MSGFGGRLVLLSLLLPKPLHGYGLYKTHTSLLGGDRRLNIGKVYTFLKQERASGGIEVCARGKRTITYALTDAGRRQAKQWLFVKEPCDLEAFDDFVARVLVRQELDLDARSILVTQREYLGRPTEVAVANSLRALQRVSDKSAVYMDRQHHRTIRT